MNSLFEEELRGHHSTRDHLFAVVSDEDLAYKLPGENPTLGGLLVEAVYIFYGKLSTYLKALERDAGREWAAWVG